MAKQIARKLSAKKAIKAGKSTASSKQQLQLRDVSSQAKKTSTISTKHRNNKKLILQGKREEAHRRAREWARREFGGKKNGTTSSSFPSASAAATTFTSMAATRHSGIDWNEEEEKEDDDEIEFEDEEEVEEEKEANVNVHPLFQKHVTKRTPSLLGVDESMDDDVFYDAMDHLLNDDEDGDECDKRRNKWGDPDAVAIAALSANVCNFHAARRRSLVSKQVPQQQWQYTTRTTSRQSLDPSGYSFSTYVSKPNP
jgi:hypothetical protein